MPLAQPLTRSDSAMKRLLRDLGRGVASGASVVGNTLNKPDRAFWGSLNALAGGESGGGLLNLIPFSDTLGITDPNDGIEASDFLANQGLIPKNDPTKWETWDVGRGLIDTGLSPTSWLAPLPLTKLGAAAAKTGKLTKGIAPSIASGERALVGLQAPFGLQPFATMGTGAEAAQAVSGIAGSKVGKAFGRAIDPLNRQRKQWFDAKVGNTITGVGQRTAQEAREFTDPIRRQMDASILPVARELEQSGRKDSGRLIREFRETGAAPAPLDPLDQRAVQVIGDVDDQIVQLAIQNGAPLRMLSDPAVSKTGQPIRHAARYASGDVAVEGGLMADKAARSAMTRRDKARL